MTAAMVELEKWRNRDSKKRRWIIAPVGLNEPHMITISLRQSRTCVAECGTCPALVIEHHVSLTELQVAGYGIDIMLFRAKEAIQKMEENSAGPQQVN